jgi:hypothetical protein
MLDFGSWFGLPIQIRIFNFAFALFVQIAPRFQMRTAGTLGEANTALHAEHQRPMAIAIVANPQLGLIKINNGPPAMERVPDFAGNAGFNALLFEFGHFGVAGGEEQQFHSL